MFFLNWFVLITQLRYPILCLFGDEVEESFWLEGPDMYERFLPGRAEVRGFSFCLDPSLDSLVF